MRRFWTLAIVLLTILLTGASSLHAQAAAAAAKGQIIEVRQVGRVTLARVYCPDNRLTLEIWLAPGTKAPWLKKDANVNVVPHGAGQEVRFSPGRLPRSDYSRPQPVRVLISNGTAAKATATLVGITFH